MQLQQERESLWKTLLAYVVPVSKFKRSICNKRNSTTALPLQDIDSCADTAKPLDVDDDHIAAAFRNDWFKKYGQKMAVGTKFLYRSIREGISAAVAVMGAELVPRKYYLPPQHKFKLEKNGTVTHGWVTPIGYMKDVSTDTPEQAEEKAWQKLRNQNSEGAIFRQNLVQAVFEALEHCNDSGNLDLDAVRARSGVYTYTHASLMFTYSAIRIIDSCAHIRTCDRCACMYDRCACAQNRCARAQNRCTCTLTHDRCARTGPHV